MRVSIYAVYILSWLCIAVSVFGVFAQETLVRPSEQEGAYVPTQNGSELDSGVVLVRENPEIANLKQELDKRENHIRQTEEEIDSINEDLREIYKKKDTLESELESLSLTNRRNEAQIRVTEGRIQQGKLRVTSLDSSIGTNEGNIETLHRILVNNYQRANEFELQDSEMSIFLNPSLFEVLRSLEELERYSTSLRNQLQLLEQETKYLEENKGEVADEQITLTREQRALEDRKKIYKFSIVAKQRLVDRTKNDEAVYQKLLRDKQEERLELQQEIYEYESRIEYLYDPDAVPEPRRGLLRRPFNPVARVTQNFGETSFAKANARRYGRPFHDGIDFALPSGTELLSSAAGIIIGTGNTDLVPSCQSWGKWVLIRHAFGLTTLYAHLSLTKVRLGQRIEMGDLIGYSGNTGFSTGPHLHFGVYDSNGIRVVPYEQVSASARCRGLLVPVAATEAKLDPREYLQS